MISPCQVHSKEAHQYSWSLDPRHLVMMVSGCCWQSLPPKTLRNVPARHISWSLGRNAC